MKLAMKTSIASLFFSAIACLAVFPAPNAEEKNTDSAQLVATVMDNQKMHVVTVNDLDDLELPTTLEQKFSYAYSYLLFLSTIQQNVALDGKYYAKGALDAANSRCLYTKEELAQIIQEMQKKLILQAQNEYNKKAEDNQKKTQVFLKENASKEGIEQTGDGIQYKVLSEGDGPMPQAGQNVKISYKITTLDGKVVDQSNGEQVFSMDSLSSVFSGALKIMHTGAENLFYVPSALVNGINRFQGLEPNILLLIDVKLSEIIPVKTTESHQ
ncbi:MAG: hypothetical protein LKE40_14245 [Spirochaetia bacterium]|nr:hypothetical protein [Spirochaetia bacterium]